MNDLSPAAQAVMESYGKEVGGTAAITSYERRGLAAALRVAAYKVAPARPVLDCCGLQEQQIRHQLLAIASELEAQP